MIWMEMPFASWYSPAVKEARDKVKPGTIPLPADHFYKLEARCPTTHASVPLHRGTLITFCGPFCTKMADLSFPSMVSAVVWCGSERPHSPKVNFIKENKGSVLSHLNKVSFWHSCSVNSWLGNSVALVCVQGWAWRSRPMLPCR